MDADEWIRRQARAKDEVYDLINKGGTDNLLIAVDDLAREANMSMADEAIERARKVLLNVEQKANDER